MVPYLLQRGVFKKQFNNSKGIDGNVELDYMGSSEFEWGALPKSLRRICDNLSQYIWFKHPKFEHIQYLAIKQDDQLEAFLTAHCVETYPQQYRTKEYTSICDAVNNRKDKRSVCELPNIWWDIEHDVLIVHDKFVRDAKKRVDCMLVNVNAKYQKSKS